LNEKRNETKFIVEPKTPILINYFCLSPNNVSLWLDPSGPHEKKNLTGGGLLPPLFYRWSVNYA